MYTAGINGLGACQFDDEVCLTSNGDWSNGDPGGTPPVIATPSYGSSGPSQPNWWEKLTANLLTTGVNTASKVAIISATQPGTIVSPNGAITRYPVGTNPSVFGSFGSTPGSVFGGISGTGLLLIGGLGLILLMKR